MIGQSKAAALVAASSLLLVDLALAGSVPVLARQVETTLPDCTKLATNGTIYTGVKEKFEILCGYDFPGGDYAAVQAATFEDCIKACEDDETCSDVAYGFGSQGCYLKDTVSAAKVNAGVYAARKIPNADAPISCKDPATHNTTYSHGTESQFQILCDTDFAGGDLAAIGAETFADCIAACDADDKCLDVSYGFRTKTCWLKGEVTTSNPADGIWTARKKTEEDTGPKTVVTCENNASNNTIYKSGDSSFLVLCGFDYGGGDMGGSPQPTFADCMDACAATEGCVDVSYAGGFCYMKNTLTTLSPAGWVWTGKKVVDTTVPVPTGSDLTCTDGAWDGKNFTTSSGNKYTIICGREYPGGDLKGVDAATFEDCVEACDATEGCIDVSYVAPACYLKSSLTTLQDAGYVSTALFVGRPVVADPVVPLSCVDNKDNGTQYSTPAGNQYVILCGVDYFGGDMSMVYTDTFEKCIDACENNDGCIDVAYSGTACYMKNELVGDAPTSAPWAWNARLVGKATPTTSTSSAPASTATETSETPCSTAAAGKFIPSQDTDIDRSSPERLTPALTVELNYAEQPGNRVLQMELALSTPAVLLENIAQLTSVTCSESSVLVTFPLVSDLTDDALTGWADNKPLLITYFDGCNIETARGFWAPTSYTFSTTSTRSILFAATQVNMTDIATEATLKYGTIDAGVESFTSTTVGAAAQPTAVGDQTCAASSTVATSATTTASSQTSATATPSDRPLPETLEDLTPAARELYDFIMANLPVDADGNLNYNVPPQKVTELQVAPYDPDNAGKQQELEDMFRDAGLDSPEDLVAKAASGVGGVCEAPGATVQRRLLQPSRRIQREVRARSQARNYAGWVHSKLQERRSRLMARDDGWDIACDDLVTGLLGIVGLDKPMEAVCAGKSLYDNRDAFKCIFGGCKTTTIITTTTTYDFNYAWKIDFPSIQSWLTKTGENKVLTCVNCGFSVSNIAFAGKIVVSITEGVITIKSADVTPGISGVANMIVRLQSDGAYKGTWSHNFNSLELGPIQMDSAFKISPTVLYGIGIDFSTDSAVDVTGGATFRWNDAAAPINIMSRTLSGQRNWQPSVSITNPSFKTGASVSIKPYMRWLVNLSVDIYGMVKIAPSITSQTVVGIDSTYSFNAANGCPANSLKVNTYLNTANAISFGDGTGATLYSGQAGSTNQCFTVPGLFPSPQEVESLKAVGGPYCTSYLKYVPPVTALYATTTTTVPSTTTSYATQMVTSTTTIWAVTTTSVDVYSTTTLSAVTATVTAAAGRTPNFSFLNQKRDNQEPTPTAAAGGALGKRQAVAQPTMLAGWDATKISFACKQVATGTSTLLQTMTSTVTSGVTTATATMTINNNGPLITSTRTQTMGRFLGASTVTVPDATSTTTVCPTPVATSCFKLKVHGAWWVEGKYMRYSQYGGFHPDRTTYPYDTFYLSKNGHLMGYNAQGGSNFLAQNYPYASDVYFGEVYFQSTQYMSSMQQATCWKENDPCSKSLQCKITDAAGIERIGMSLQIPIWSYYDPRDPRLSAQVSYTSNSFRPAWGIPSGSGWTWIPVTFEYEDAPCPCY